MQKWFVLQVGFFSIVGIPLFQALAGLFKEAQVSLLELTGLLSSLSVVASLMLECTSYIEGVPCHHACYH